VKILHMVKENDWQKIYAWEIGCYGAGGRWGLPPPAVSQSKTFRQLLGLNGIWGWGSNSFSDTAAKAGAGPLLYNAVASSGRNYQSMVWDVRKPGNDPKWETMNKVSSERAFRMFVKRDPFI
jgi:serine/threonine-protein kinase ATR